MLKIEKKLIYNAFGLYIISEIHLPELSIMTNMEVDSDVDIKIEV